jgi:hypothetical protein
MISKPLNKLKWVMAGLFLISALLLTSNISISKIGFLLFLIGHFIGVLVFYIEKDTPMFYHSILFIFIDIWGIYRWYF